MVKQELENVAKAKRPLVEVSIVLTEGTDSQAVMRQLNALTDDFHATLSVYTAITGDTHLLTADATPEALLPMFCWEIERVNLERWNQETQKYEGVCAYMYRWQETNRLTKYPACLEGKVAELV